MLLRVLDGRIGDVKDLVTIYIYRELISVGGSADMLFTLFLHQI